MARKRTRSNRTEAKRKRRLCEGAIVRVTRFINPNESFEYEAIVHVLGVSAEGESVKCVLEPIRVDYLRKLKEARAYFGTTRINRLWWSISAIPVELSRHTEIGTTMTAVVMSRLGRASLAYY